MLLEIACLAQLESTTPHSPLLEAIDCVGVGKLVAQLMIEPAGGVVIERSTISGYPTVISHTMSRYRLYP